VLGPPAFESLVPALRDSDWRVREGAARAFGHMHDVRSVSYLVAVLYDGGYWDVRWAAVEALMNMGNSAIKPLVRALKDNIDLVYGNYHFFIGKGLRETEDVLIDALSEYGDTRMAEDFLQCGNARLARFGAIWANKHGYIFSSVPNGRNGPHWGQSN
jgi:HEAT repeat protein